MCLLLPPVRPIAASQSDRLSLQDCLEVGREARVRSRFSCILLFVFYQPNPNPKVFFWMSFDFRSLRWGRSPPIQTLWSRENTCVCCLSCTTGRRTPSGSLNWKSRYSYSGIRSVWVCLGELPELKHVGQNLRMECSLQLVNAKLSSTKTVTTNKRIHSHEVMMSPWWWCRREVVDVVVVQGGLNFLSPGARHANLSTLACSSHQLRTLCCSVGLICCVDSKLALCVIGYSLAQIHSHLEHSTRSDTR